jgi:hypothetical protein
MLKKIYRYKDRPVRESDKRSEDDLNPNPKNMSSSKCKKKIYRYKDWSVRDSDKRSEKYDLNPNPKNMKSSKCLKNYIVTKIGQLETRINEVKKVT